MALSARGLVDMVLLGHRLDSMMSEIFSRLIDSVILCSGAVRRPWEFTSVSVNAQQKQDSLLIFTHITAPAVSLYNRDLIYYFFFLSSCAHNKAFVL